MCACLFRPCQALQSQFMGRFTLVFTSHWGVWEGQGVEWMYSGPREVWVTVELGMGPGSELVLDPNTLDQLWAAWICATSWDGKGLSSPIGAAAPTGSKGKEYPCPGLSPNLPQPPVGYEAGQLSSHSSTSYDWAVKLINMRTWNKNTKYFSFFKLQHLEIETTVTMFITKSFNLFYKPEQKFWIIFSDWGTSSVDIWHITKPGPQTELV